MLRGDGGRAVGMWDRRDSRGLFGVWGGGEGARWWGMVMHDELHDAMVEIPFCNYLWGTVGKE